MGSFVLLALLAALAACGREPIEGQGGGGGTEVNVPAPPTSSTEAVRPPETEAPPPTKAVPQER